VDAALGWWQRRRLRWHLVETSPVLRLQQQSRLGAGRMRWHDSMEQALAACGGRAVIFSNEVPDAFPVTLLEWQDGQWREVWLEINSAGGLVETIRPWSCQDGAAAALRPRDGDFRPAQRVEFPSAWAAWLAGWRPQWHAGRMLTIDYGGPFAEVYARRPAGTLRAYLRHERKTGIRIYESMGRQDITADVCVDDLTRIGESNGLKTLGWQTQREFILKRSGRPPKTREEVQLLDESGAGAAFFVLEQVAGDARK
jgi:SAM-dependent MidA family methyltransferase